MAPTSDEPTTNPSIKWYALALLIACVLMGLFCCELNRQLYRHHHPFYDSMSYHEKMFRVITIARESGIAESLKTACFSNSTTPLPFVIGATIAPIVHPTRLIGVWIQTGLLYIFLLSLLIYLVRIRELKQATALSGCFLFLAAKCIFMFNGGMSDFRMDLSLFLGFGTTCIWFLTSMVRPTKSHFLLLGIAASTVCLFRATAPVYLLFSLLPLCAMELLFGDKKREKLFGLIGATFVVVALAGWFFYANFAFLKYYYVDWNTDANAKIPFIEALTHWDLARRSLGEPLIVLIWCWGIATLVMICRRQSVFKWIATAWSSRDIDWRIGWIGLAPIVLMIARRAGLNPFVTMPAAFGLVLFFTLPFMKQRDQINSKALNWFCWLLLFAAVLLAMSRGWKRHSPDGFDTMAAHHLLIDNMLVDAKTRKQDQLRYGVLHLTDLNSASLYSTLLYDREDAMPNLYSVDVDGVEIRRINTFSRPAATDWQLVKGNANSEKIDFLMADANARIDYLILPDDDTARDLETTAAHNYINRHLVAIRKRVVSDQSWVLVGKPIPTNEREVVEIYRRTRKPNNN